MGFMAGMLPGVEFARRRRLRPAAEAPCAGPRRPSSLGTFGHDHAHLGSAGFAKRSGACEEAWTTQLDSIAREAKERLDQKLRSQRESMAKRRHSTGSLRLPAPCAGPRRPSSLGTFGHDHAHLGSAGFAKQRSGACEEAWTTQLDSIAREAKERLDQKLRSQRESMAKRPKNSDLSMTPAC
ncbi:hypothetical protein ZWY2020_023255 [Hordeum vulgare]|nr:hypothetical protein ZWY2020_023255 [Hordeum vulgare]